MIEKRKREVLFMEIHRAIDEAAENVILSLKGPTLSYPPNVELSSDQRAALSSFRLSDAARLGLRKIVADACSKPLFHLLSLMDAVADPDDDFGDVWLGATLEEKSEEDEPMLHDELYETYWLYKKAMKKNG